MARKPAPKKPMAEKMGCMKCERQLAESNFYMNENELFSSKKSVICKKCMNDYIGEKDSVGYLDRVKMVLAILNKPLILDLWISRGSDWTKYIPQLSSFPQYKGMTFADSTFDGLNTNIIQKTVPVIIQEIDTEDVEQYDFEGRWVGFDLKDAIMLEDKFQKLLTVYPCDTPIQENGYKQIAIIQLKSDEAIMNSKTKEYKDLQETLSKIMNDLKIKPVQENSTEDGGLSNWGSWVKKIEEEEPIPEATGEFKDPDGIKKYVNKWFTSHFAKVFGLSTHGEYEEDIGKESVADSEPVDEDGDE